MLRPGVVFFGEETEHLEEIGKLLIECDIFCVVGTLSVVSLKQNVLRGPSIGCLSFLYPR